MCRRLLLVDFDPERPAKTSSSTVEKALVFDRARDCRTWISKRYGWGAPVFCDSGNGAHLLYPLASIPINEETDRYVCNCLKLLDRNFSDDFVKVDTSVSNPARITKLYSTWTRKGSRPLKGLGAAQPSSKCLLQVLNDHA